MPQNDRHVPQNSSAFTDRGHVGDGLPWGTGEDGLPWGTGEDGLPWGTGGGTAVGRGAGRRVDRLAVESS